MIPNFFNIDTHNYETILMIPNKNQNKKNIEGKFMSY